MTLTFHDLGLSEARAQQLDRLEFTTPTPIQARAIPPLLAGQDVVGLAQTGTGKTAAFGLPMLDRLDEQTRAVQALILTPTRELAMQVCKAIESFIGQSRLKAITVYGGQSIERQVSQLQRGAQIVVGTPGRVMDLMDRGSLKLDRVNWVVLDEADEMLNMGFIQDVEKIFSALPENRQTAFFSATMSPTIRKLVAKLLHAPVFVSVEQTQGTPTRIEQNMYVLQRGYSKLRALMPILEMEDPDSAIIFVRTKQAAADLTAQLQAAGYSADEYHGNLNQSQRERLLSRFRRGHLKLIVATDIAARGLDVDRLSHVINFELPDNLENYVHRIGRTGRAGRAGKAISLTYPLDRYRVRQIERHTRQPMIQCELPTRASLEARRIERFETRLREALAGDRVASFLPIVSRLGEEYDPRAVAAAALQLAYDLERPQRNFEAMANEDERTSKPRSASGGGGRRERGGDRFERNGDERPDRPRRILDRPEDGQESRRLQREESTAGALD